MARNFKDVEYTKVDLDSPHRGFVPGDNTLGLQDDEEDEIDSSSGAAGAATASKDGAASAAASGEEDATAKKPSLLSMAYYQRFFNVDTRQVGLRVLGSFVPRPGRNFVADDIRHSPDLYGPFWVCTTLVFTVAIAGNVADYFQTSSRLKDYGGWVYDFQKVTFASTAVYLYWWLVPLLLWAVSWWRQLPERLTFLELLCLYGYSLAIYIPVSILCVIQLVALQWTLVLLGMLLSGAVLGLSLWPSVSSGERRTGIALLTVAGVLHAALAVGFKLYFFYVISLSSTVSPSTLNSSTSSATSPAALSSSATSEHH